MNAPTPEDCKLRDLLMGRAGLEPCPHWMPESIWIKRRVEAAQVIAAHCAPLRELAEIGRLAVILPLLEKDKNAHYMALSDAWDAFGRAVDAYNVKRQTP